jgi:hypothetical protein
VGLLFCLLDCCHLLYHSPHLPNKVNALSMQVFQLVDEHTMAAPIGGANEDDDSKISRDVEGSAAEHEYYATARLMEMATVNPATTRIDWHWNSLIGIEAT